MKAINITLLIISLFIYSNTIAQDTLVHENVDLKEYEKTNYGPNSKNYFFIYQTVTFYTPSVYGDQYAINYVKSYDYYYGLTYKLKIFSFFSNGLSVFYNFQNINLKDQLTTAYSSTMKDKIMLNNFGAEYFWRFSLGKHGNTVGKFFEFGVWGKMNLGNRYTIKTQDNTSLYNSTTQKEVYKNTDLFNKYPYGASLKIGSKQFSFVANYALSNLFTDNTIQTKNIFDLPKLSVGIEIAIVE